MKSLFDKVSAGCSKLTTEEYSTSFSLGIKLLDKKFHGPIYAIYGFVRFADEIVDSFHEYDKAALLRHFREETYKAITDKISLNPILNSFQSVYHTFNIEQELVDTFLDSMEMDLHQHFYTRSIYEQYILGSAEVVGLMCLKVFTEGNDAIYNQLRTPAMKLGAAFQKVNFLRDVKSDSQQLGRHYFPLVNLEHFTNGDKFAIEAEISADFQAALTGIFALPLSSRKGVYLAYAYYQVLFKKIKSLPAQRIMNERVRVPNTQKLGIMLQTYLFPFNLLQQ
ncbi:phytoene/squalene synthase family protein [Chitinophaga sp. LS1]|uniref:phytoene/squalene synthase family protein n=1 Tax=Chitinophaga sp. LS1 TaxID=3051176 RepID=UPI002AAA7584|nr:phytoene/squalene synthase family protein [Chitinophaga sp. LS1]WPV70516.1 phytoene/squalene synthase family protein [Chitinophaga sp. LS1]